jgi:hypothetical protein
LAPHKVGKSILRGSRKVELLLSLKLGKQLLRWTLVRNLLARLLNSHAESAKHSAEPS